MKIAGRKILRHGLKSLLAGAFKRGSVTKTIEGLVDFRHLWYLTQRCCEESEIQLGRPQHSHND